MLSGSSFLVAHHPECLDILASIAPVHLRSGLQHVKPDETLRLPPAMSYSVPQDSLPVSLVV